MTHKNITGLFDDLKNESQIFLSYLKAKFPIFHNSNLFSRDFQYGLKSFLEKKGITLTDINLDSLAKQFYGYYETLALFRDSEFSLAIYNVLLNVVLCLVGIYLAYLISKLIG